MNIEMDRRTMLLAGGLSFVATAAGATPSMTPVEAAPQSSGSPEPAQAPARTGMAELPDVKLDFWDTGGNGEPVILLHPRTGSNAIWGYQQPVLVRAGYRVIAYSRRGFGRSESGPPNRTGSSAGDLKALADLLNLGRFHLVGSAGGGFVVPDFALAHPDRLLSITIANSLGGIEEPSWKSDTQMLIPRGFFDLPPDFRELSPSYRFANPAGRVRWLELEHLAVPGAFIMQRPINHIDFAALSRIAVPTLVLTGDADHWLPPARARDMAARIPGARVEVIAETSHSAYWEQPDAFNSILISFLRQHRSAGVGPAIEGSGSFR